MYLQITEQLQHLTQDLYNSERRYIYGSLCINESPSYFQLFFMRKNMNCVIEDEITLYKKSPEILCFFRVFLIADIFS